MTFDGKPLDRVFGRHNRVGHGLITVAMVRLSPRHRLILPSTRYPRRRRGEIARKASSVKTASRQLETKTFHGCAISPPLFNYGAD